MNKIVVQSLDKMTSAIKKTDVTKVKKAAKPSTTVKVDSGSPETQVTLMTTQINEITGHLKVNPKDHMARRGLLQLVGKRRRQLAYLAKKDSQAYLALVKKLGLRR
jgi:small subunit ribosomal protein S15